MSLSIKIKPNSTLERQIVFEVIEAFNLRKQSVNGAKSYIDEHNPDFSITLKQIRLILEQNNIETKKGRVKNG
jgi:hypothetical protein